MRKIDQNTFALEVKVISIDEAVQTAKSEGRGQYLRCTVEFNNIRGEVKTSPATFWLAHADRISVGDSYYATAERNGDSVYLRVAPFTYSEGAEATDFGWETQPAEVAAQVDATTEVLS